MGEISRHITGGDEAAAKLLVRDAEILSEVSRKDHTRMILDRIEEEGYEENFFGYLAVGGTLDELCSELRLNQAAVKRWIHAGGQVRFRAYKEALILGRALSLKTDPVLDFLQLSKDDLINMDKNDRAAVVRLMKQKAEMVLAAERDSGIGAEDDANAPKDVYSKAKIVFVEGDMSEAKEAPMQDV